MSEKTTQIPPKGRFPKPYVMIWALLASVSLVYLALLAIKPALVAHYLGTERGTVAAAPATPLTPDNTASDIRAIKDSVSQVRVDLDDLKAVVSGQAAREKDFAARLGALETSAPEPAKVAMLNPVAAQPAPATPPASRPAAEKSAERAPGKAVSVQKVAGPAAQVPPAAPPGASANAQQAKPEKAAAKVVPPIPQATLETGSVAGPGATVSFGPPVVTPAAGTPATAATQAAKSLGLQIARGPSVDALRLSWSLLSDRHADSLKSLEPRYITGADASGLTYDLIVGPIANATEAKRICKELGQNGTQCKVGNFTGDAL